MMHNKQIIIGLLIYAFAIMQVAGVKATSVNSNGERTVPLTVQEESKFFFVSPEGNDNWTGKLENVKKDKSDGPFASISRARDAVRELQKNGQNTSPIFVYIKEGTYTLKETLVFGPEDSGSEKSPVIYTSNPGEHVIISGGRSLTGFQKDRDGLWKLKIPEVENGSWKFRQLFMGDKRLTRSRIPEEGWFLLEPTKECTTEDLSEQSSFHVLEGEIKSYKKIHEAELIVYNRWNNSRLFIDSIDEKNQVCHFKGKIFRGPTKGKRFFLENIKEGLTRPGTWYLDYETGVLYVRLDENPNEMDIVAPVLENLVLIKGNHNSDAFVSHIKFKNLSFRHATFPVPEEGITARQAASYLNAAIYAEKAQHITLERCVIENVGQYGVHFNSCCHHSYIIHNKCIDTGAGGIRLGTTERRLTDELISNHNVITDNYISDGGQTAFGCVGILATNCRYTTIAHNEVTRMKYTGISIGWDWGWASNFCRENVIEKNHIHHVGMKILSDMGGIYTLGVSPGTYIRGNLIHDIWPYNDSGRGIYLDEGSTGYIVENNIIYNTLSASIRFQRGTTANFVKNNIFALSKEWIVGYDSDRFNVFQKNLVYWKEGNLFKHNRIYSFDTVFDLNIYWNPEDSNPEFAGYSFDEWRKQRRPKDFFVSFPAMDRNSYYANPQFEDPENGNFNLSPDSPAFKVGFQPIDMSDVGIREYMGN